MRIALVITELDPGGAENCLTQLACYLADKGNVVRVFAIGPPPDSDQDYLLRELSAHQVFFGFCIGRGGVRSIASFPKVVRWLKSELRKFEPDVVQSMLFHGNLVSALAFDPKQTVLFGGVRVRQPQRWRWWLQRWASRRMRKVVCVSNDVQRHCQQHEHIASDKLVTIANGIDLQSVDRLVTESSGRTWSELGLPAEARVLLFVGRLHPQKGVEQLVARADELLRQLPEHHLVLIGNGPLESRLRTLAKKHNAASRIHLVGWLPNVIQWMHRAELLLLPAAYEGMPNVLLEAMAVGLPFVAYDIDGIRQLLGDSPQASQQIVEPGNLTQFIHSATRLANNPAARASFATENRKRIEGHFRLEQQLAAYLALYDQRV